MKKFSKILSVVMVGAMVTAMMTGCGSESSGKDVFKIGGIGPVTGGAALYGINVKNSAQIALDEINANGGVNGYKLELNFQDDEHDPEKAVNA